MEFTNFLSQLKINGSNLIAYQQEEYLLTNGTIDIKYLSQQLHAYTTREKLNAMLNTTCGRVSFEIKELENEVSQGLFNKHYIFGTYPNVRSWIGYFDRTCGLLLTREALYEYLLKG